MSTATACYLVCDVKTGRVLHANAGHPKPLSIHPGSGTLVTRPVDVMTVGRKFPQRGARR